MKPYTFLSPPITLPPPPLQPLYYLTPPYQAPTTPSTPFNNLNLLACTLAKSLLLLRSPRLCPVISIIMKKVSMMLGGTLHSNCPVKLQPMALAPMMRPMMVTTPRRTAYSWLQMAPTRREMRSVRLFPGTVCIASLDACCCCGSCGMSSCCLPGRVWRLSSKLKATSSSHPTSLNKSSSYPRSLWNTFLRTKPSFMPTRPA